jgi:hypothetical protein
VAQPDGQVIERHVFVMQVTEDGRVLMDYGENGDPVERSRIQPFPVRPGRSLARDGKIMFPESQQRPHVPGAQSYRQ